MASCQSQSTELDRTTCFSILALTIGDEIEGSHQYRFNRVRSVNVREMDSKGCTKFTAYRHLGIMYVQATLPFYLFDSFQRERMYGKR